MCVLREWRAPQGQRPTLLQVTSMQLLSTIGKTIRDLLRKRRLGPESRDALRILANALDLARQWIDCRNDHEPCS
jgi:hypothetical protein